MKLTQFWRNGFPVLGLVTEDGGVIDVAAEATRKNVPDCPDDMFEAILMGEDMVREALTPLLDDPICMTEYRPAPVVPETDRIFCIGLNYRQHAMECKLPLPSAPVLFNKFGNALSADGDVVTLSPDYKEYDYEAELVVIMGQTARNVSEEDALDYVFGYTCGNDLSTRDLQFARGNQWLLSKTFDGFAPVGPSVVLAVDLDPSDLAISSRVNGELRQNSRTSDLIFSVPQLIADLSRHITLKPGDLIFTGTPSGVMHGYPADKKNWLKPGDQVEITIEGIGTLHTSFC